MHFVFIFPSFMRKKLLSVGKSAHTLMWNWIFSIALIAACACILFEIKARAVSLLLALVFLLLVLAFQVPGLPYPGILGSWTGPFKELSLSAGAFIIAGSFSDQN